MVYAHYECPVCQARGVAQVPERTAMELPDWLDLAFHCVKYEHGACNTDHFICYDSRLEVTDH